MFPKSQPNIADIHILCGAQSNENTAPSLVFEIPHGATDTADFNAYRAMLKSPLPDGLVDFFHVNTDVGAFEVAMKAGQRWVDFFPNSTAVIIRCRIPRTFIDCNRRIDASPDDYKAGKVTPGLMPWITDDNDHQLLVENYRKYHAIVDAISATMASDAGIVLLHTYSPYSVDVQVDENIVENLRHAYLPDVVTTWPVRPEFDVISTDTDGNDYAPTEVVAVLRDKLARHNWPVHESGTYPLHPSTMAWNHVMAHPKRSLCLEIRRDLLADPFEPFAQMAISTSQVDIIGTALAKALSVWGEI